MSGFRCGRGAPPATTLKEPLFSQSRPSFLFPGETEGKNGEPFWWPTAAGFQSRTGCEGMNAALHFARRGFHTAILTYRLQPYTRYDAMSDMQRAIRLIRFHRQEWGVTERVAAMGFSAGGMLSGNCATHFDRGDPQAADPVERESCRPDAAVICYGPLPSPPSPVPSA